MKGNLSRFLAVLIGVIVFKRGGVKAEDRNASGNSPAGEIVVETVGGGAGATDDQNTITTTAIPYVSPVLETMNVGGGDVEATSSFPSTTSGEIAIGFSSESSDTTTPSTEIPTTITYGSAATDVTAGVTTIVTEVTGTGGISSSTNDMSQTSPASVNIAYTVITEKMPVTESFTEITTGKPPPPATTLKAASVSTSLNTPASRSSFDVGRLWHVSFGLICWIILV